MIKVYLASLTLLLFIAVAGWFYSVRVKRVDIVDILWSLMSLVCALLYFISLPEIGFRPWLILTLVQLWSLRLAVHLYMRNQGEPEDRRYQQIRKNNQPFFEYKSLWLVFLLQAILAWIISIPLHFAIQTVPVYPWLWLDCLALMLWIVGFVFESVSDWQLYIFKKNKQTNDQVLDTGLWRYTRHPNYFGEFCIWWAFYLFAIPAGGWWTLYAPLLMTVLLLRVSGVGLMEQEISERRPAYADYKYRTPVFFPGKPKVKESSQ